MQGNLVYRLSDKPPLWISILSAFQWFIFTLASSLVVPVVIGHAFGFSQMETAALVQRTFLFVGLASFLQVTFGHRYPIMEGPAGMWWGIFLILLNLAPTLGKTPLEIGQNLEMGLLVTGFVIIILGITRTISKIQKWFTPIVTGTYMILLAISMSGSFIGGMLGIGYHGDQIKWVLSLLSVFLIGFVIYLSSHRNPIFRSFSILIGIAVGWGIYAWLGLVDTPIASRSIFTAPDLFAFGTPKFDLGITLTSLLTGFILISNLITSVAVMGDASLEQPNEKTFNQGGIFTGVAHMLSGIGATIGLVPLAIAAGMVKTTGNASRISFIISTFFMMSLGFFPAIGLFFSVLPAPVGYAVLFTTYAQLLSFGLKDYEKIPLNPRNLAVIGISLMIGVGTMFIPQEALAGIHPIFSYLLGNGLILGVLISLLLEHIIYRKQAKQEGSEP
ncbi:MAG: purine/pyrimidine permease [Tepidibacillus sp.]